MKDVNIVPNKIIDVIKKRGPSLPIQIAKEVGISSLFASAFLSELLENRKIKISSLRVGGSPLYFIEGQEAQLEKFSNYLHSKEQEALQLLKSQKFLKDSEQEPAIRVALKGIKDFAENFRKDSELYWKLILTPQSEIESLLEPKIQKQEIKEETIEIKPEIKKIEIQKELIDKVKEKDLLVSPVIEKPKIKLQRIFQKSKTQIKQIPDQFENPLIEKPVEKPKKEKPKSEFVLKTINFLLINNFKILEEKYYKAKEYQCISEIFTNLGPISFLTLAKDKKSISDDDLKKLLSESQRIPLPALLLSSGDLTKKAREYQEKYYSILKYIKII